MKRNSWCNLSKDGRFTCMDSRGKGFTRPSSSPWGGPILFVRKKDGPMRMCIENHELNKLTVENRYPLPRIDDLFDQLLGTAWSSTIDLYSGYHQVKVTVTGKDVHKTASKSRYECFKFVVMTFGLAYASAVFCGPHESPKLDRSVIVFTYDIPIYSKIKGEHAKLWVEVLETLQKEILYSKFSKCDSRLQDGHFVNRKGIKVDPARVGAIAKREVPKTPTEIWSFLGLARYYRWFIQDFSDLAVPLIRLVRKNMRLLGWRAARSFCGIMEKVVVSIDATRGIDTWQRIVVLVAWVRMYVNAVWEVYASRQLKTHEAFSPTHVLELAAVVFALKL
ncbi:LOW QUALITY PROTEIN: hypothetical protein OSB04_024267 [Centaurea solstitialis]|uniref:Reverse transcriptase domain-containing protein n=1 Tax=Centaurea solstitialis TaxID=347529 RepID=A0AA38SKS2_9ASTR|nr:LOW QUALITY PROTEIN: hypothetical protein OSB04_024267 [Centaurea solstitialis]